MSVRILIGDCRDTLRELPDGCVQTVVTSPPYFGLRDYGTGEWEGGDPECDHLGKPFRTKSKLNENWGAGYSDVKNTEDREPMGQCCSKCGARRVDRQIGLEPSPDEFVQALVGVFRAVRRVLRDDGTVWLNLGDSYNNRAVNRPSSHQAGLGFESEHLGTSWRDHAANGRARMSITDGDLKEKDLLGIPWMVAFALRADGWYLRSDIIWSKPNPMPESVTDRPTKAHEYVFLLSKGPRYFYDADAIREDVALSQVGRVRADPIGGKSWQGRQQHSAGAVYQTGSHGRGVGDSADRDERRLTGEPLEGAAVEPLGNESLYLHEPIAEGVVVAGADLDCQADVGAVARGGVASHDQTIPSAVSNGNDGRNKRSVWTVATQPYPGAHFATFPSKLIEPCILAGSSPKACGVCGAPWQRVVERTTVRERLSANGDSHVVGKDADLRAQGSRNDDLNFSNSHNMSRTPEVRTVGWEPSCGHQDDTGQSVVLDPFAGSGTTGAVALEHGRAFIGCELNPAYGELIRDRLLSAPLALEGFGAA